MHERDCLTLKPSDDTLEKTGAPVKAHTRLNPEQTYKPCMCLRQIELEQEKRDHLLKTAQNGSDSNMHMAANAPRIREDQLDDGWMLGHTMATNSGQNISTAAALPASTSAHATMLATKRQFSDEPREWERQGKPEGQTEDVLPRGLDWAGVRRVAGSSRCGYTPLTPNLVPTGPEACKQMLESKQERICLEPASQSFLFIWADMAKHEQRAAEHRRESTQRRDATWLVQHRDP